MLAGLPYEVISMTEAGVTGDIAENGDTFEENALIKAREVRRMTGEAVMARRFGSRGRSSWWGAGYPLCKICR